MRELDQNIIEEARTGDGRYQVISATVFRPSYGDASNGGVSGRAGNIYVICPGGWLNAADLIREGHAVFAIESLGAYKSLTQVEIVDGQIKRITRPGMIGPMFGGNLADSSDSRWRRASIHPVRIHDRYETQEQSDILSR